MKTLIDISSSQTLYILPRVYASNVYYTLVNEDTKVSVTATNLTTSTVSGYLSFSNTFDLDSDVFYEIWVYDTATDDLIYRDKIFVSNQLVIGVFVSGLFEPGLFAETSGYDINNGEYTQNTTYDNEYLIYNG